MDITPKVSSNINIIRSYGDKGYEVGDKFYSKSIILSPENIEMIGSFDNCLGSANINFLNDDTEIFLIGTGKDHVIISGEIKDKIKNKFPNVSINEMSSSSACRTFNVLATEQRNVVALLKCL